MTTESLNAENVVKRRKRTSKPKTRTGCLTCRQRKKKCDETRPHCLNCFRAGWVCDGYSTPFIHVIKSWASPAEGRGMQFFMEQTGPQSAGYFELEFWDRFVMSVSNSQPAIKHLVLALAYFHESAHPGLKISGVQHELEEKKKNSLRECNRALHLLIHGGNTIPRSVVLLASLLFFRLDTLKGSFLSAFKHIDNGMRLINELRVEPNKYGNYEMDKDTLETVIYPALGRFDVRNNVFENWNRIDRPRISLHRLNIPPIFSGGLHEARLMLGSIIRGIMDEVELLQGRSDYDKFEQIQSRTKEVLDQWRIAHDALLKSLKNKAVPDVLRHGQLQKGAHLAVGIIVETAIIQDEMAYDQFLDEFMTINESCLPGLNDSISSSVSRLLSGQSLESEAIPALSFVASTCRVGSIRRRAIVSLRSMSRNATFQHCGTLADIFEKRMLAEEADATFGVIASQSRLRLVNWGYSPERHLFVANVLSYPYSESLGAKIQEITLPVRTDDDPYQLNGAMFQSSFASESINWLDLVSFASIADDSSNADLQPEGQAKKPHSSQKSNHLHPHLVDRPNCLSPYPLRELQQSIRAYAKRSFGS